MADGRHVAAQHGASPVNGRRLSAPGDGKPSPAADQRDPAGPSDDRDAGFQPVGCERCGATVLVAKFSPRHTSVQWSLASVHACTEFSARAAAGEQTALIDTCASLRDSIDRAVLQGRLEVPPP